MELNEVIQNYQRVLDQSLSSSASYMSDSFKSGLTLTQPQKQTPQLSRYQNQKRLIEEQMGP